MIPGSVFLLCAGTCLFCVILLWRGYTRSGVRLLLWSSLCFFFLMLENVMLYVDVHVFPQVPFGLWRTIPGLIAVVVLLIGLIWESE